MKRRSNLSLRSVLAMLWTYGVLGGVTATGVLTPQYALVTLVLIMFTVVGWLVIRWRKGWPWHRTPIDNTLILWAVAITLSTFANLETWPRISIGLWYALAYLGLWYILQDAIANRGLDSETLVESLLLAGLLVMLFAYLELGSWFVNWSRSGGVPPELPRLAGTLDNPNILAAFLVIVIPLAAARLTVIRRRSGQVFLILYIILALILQAITFSRGGWIATFTSLLMLAILLFAHHNTLSVSQILPWWRKQPHAVRIGLWSAAIFIIVVGASMSFALVRSLDAPGRSVDLRTYIYDAAIEMFREKPLTGYGLFTFGRGLMRLASTPPYTPHSHAHNFPLNVAAELGMVGLAALVVTVFSIVRAMHHNWQTMRDSRRVLLAGAIASTIGVAVHHLFDMPASVAPIVAIAWILALSVATASTDLPPAHAWQRYVQPALLTGMWLVLLVTGFWTVNTYRDYVAVLQYVTQTGDYEGAAQRLQLVIDSDPSMPIYYLYQGYFLGVSADKASDTAIQQAIAAYRRFCDVEPYYAPAWANLGALYWQTGERNQAIRAMERAVSLAPEAWMLPFNLGMYYEAVGNVEAAHKAYLETLSLYPDASVYPEWQQTELRRKIASENDKSSLLARVASLLNAGKISEAEQMWKQVPRDQHIYTSDHVISEILALEGGDRKAAADELATAKRITVMPQNDPWIQLGIARLALFDGDKAKACGELQTARARLVAGPVTTDDGISAIAYLQFKRVGLPQYFLPQVYSPLADAPLMILLRDC